MLPRRRPGPQRRPGSVRRAAAAPRRHGHAARLAAAGRGRPGARAARGAPRGRSRRPDRRTRPRGQRDGRRRGSWRPARCWSMSGRRGEVIAGLAGRTILHAGPPIDWARMCGPVQGAVIGAVLFEGWASNAEAARGADRRRRDHASRRATTTARSGPMAGIVSPSMPVVVVENRPAGNRAFATLNEGLGRVAALRRLRRRRARPLAVDGRTLGPALAPSARAAAGRSTSSASRPRPFRWATSATTGTWPRPRCFTRRHRPGADATVDAPTAATVLEFLLANDHLFLNLSMAACKAALDAAHGVTGSTVVTAMARNGVEFGIRVSGTGERWFTDPAPVHRWPLLPRLRPGRRQSRHRR